MRSILLCLFLFLGVCTNISARAGQNHLPALPHQAAMIKALQVIDQGKWDVGEAFIGQASGTFSGQVFYWMKYFVSIGRAIYLVLMDSNSFFPNIRNSYRNLCTKNG